jgi:putative transposase
MERTPYPTDLTDNEWQLLEPLLPGSEQPGRPRQYSWRHILNAIFYVLRTALAKTSWVFVTFGDDVWPNLWI